MSFVLSLRKPTGGGKISQVQKTGGGDFCNCTEVEANHFAKSPCVARVTCEPCRRTRPTSHLPQAKPGRRQPFRQVHCNKGSSSLMVREAAKDSALESKDCGEDTTKGKKSKGRQSDR